MTQDNSDNSKNYDPYQFHYYQNSRNFGQQPFPYQGFSMSQESNSGGQGSQAPRLQRAQSSISSEVQAPLTSDEFDHMREVLGNNFNR